MQGQVCPLAPFPLNIIENFAKEDNQDSLSSRAKDLQISISNNFRNYIVESVSASRTS